MSGPVEKDFSAYTISPKPTDQSAEMAGDLAANTQPYIKSSVREFLTKVAQIPGIDAVAVEVFPNSNYIAVEWTSNTASVHVPKKDEKEREKDPEEHNPRRGIANHGGYIELANGSVARSYESVIPTAQALNSAFGELRETLKPAPFAEGKDKDVDLALNEISTIHHHNNPGGDPQTLIERYKTRRQIVAAYPSSAPLNARSSFIALGLVDHPAPISQLADVAPADSTIDKSLAVTFVGQGSQEATSARLKELSQRYMMAAYYVHLADDVLGYPLSKLMFNGPKEELTRTEHAQPAIYVATYTHFKVLRVMGLLNEPALLAGSSLGEYTAHAVAGTFGKGIDGFVEGLKVVRQRGLFMQQADDLTGPSGLMSVNVDTTNQKEMREFIHNLNRKLGITKRNDENRVVATNVNGDDQLIIGGTERALRQAQRILDSEKIKARRLAVNAAFHSFLMSFARAGMGEYLQGVTLYPIEDPDRIVFANATGKRIQTVDETRQTLTEQVDQTVLYRDMIKQFPAFGVTRIVEPGSSVQNGINSGFYEKRFTATKGKIILPGNMTGAEYTDLSELKAAA